MGKFLLGPFMLSELTIVLANALLEKYYSN